MNPTRVVVAVVASLSLASLAGCVDQEILGADSGTVRAGTATPALTVQEAGATYTALSAASNAAREKWMGAPQPTKVNLAEHKKLAGEAAAATLAFSEGLRNNTWPTEVEPLITALDEHLQERADAYRWVALQGTVPEYLAAASQVPVTTSLTGQIRLALGLPEAAVVTGVTPR